MAAHGRRNGEARGALFHYSLRPDSLKLDRDMALPDWPEAERESRERGVTGLTVRRTGSKKSWMPTRSK